MCVYVVRLQHEADHDRSFVGIYIAKTVQELEPLVERCCSKFVCEYVEVPHSCMYGPDEGLPPEDRLYAEPENPQFVAVEDLSDDWHELFFGATHLEWRSFCDAPWRSEVERHAAFEAARHALEAA